MSCAQTLVVGCSLKYSRSMRRRMKYHMIAFFGGFLLDMLIGDPHFLPHPIRLIGNLIAEAEKWLLRKENMKLAENMKLTEYEIDRNKAGKFRKGVCLVIFVLSITTAVTACILLFAYCIHPLVGIIIEMIMTYQILATKCLKVESMKVYRCLKNQNLSEARIAVSMIVGRDTQFLNEEGVAKAAIETVAENTSDGVVAPMLYTALGGPVLGFFYKAVNTMDSMIGYKNDKYLYFGRAAAKLDDFVNFIPARFSAYLMIVASFCGGKCYSGKHSFLVYKRDNRKHASPNSAQTESVCAGALGIQLAGDASYFGKLIKKPYIGDPLRSVEYEDIRHINRLMYLTAWMSEFICLLLMAAAC